MRDSASLFTVGHSTKSWQEFMDLLQDHKIKVLTDIRRFPSSRRYPHFNQGKMRVRLQEEGPIRYVHLEALGGRREPLKGSNSNAGWRSKGFRGYADHMSSDEFRNGVEQLLSLCQGSRVAIMCAEALPWQCHRILVSDYLACILNLQVHHIMPDGKLEPHSITEFALVAGRSLIYPESRTE